MPKGHVTFGELRLGHTFICELGLYVKASRSTAVRALSRSFDKKAEKRKFKPDEQVELLRKVTYKGKAGSSVVMDFL